MKEVLWRKRECRPRRDTHVEKRREGEKNKRNAVSASISEGLRASLHSDIVSYLADMPKKFPTSQNAAFFGQSADQNLLLVLPQVQSRCILRSLALRRASDCGFSLLVSRTCCASTEGAFIPTTFPSLGTFPVADAEFPHPWSVAPVIGDPWWPCPHVMYLSVFMIYD